MPGFALLSSGQGMQRFDLIDKLRAYPEAMAALESLTPLIPDDLQVWLNAPNDNGLFRDAIAQPLIALYQIMAWHLLKAHLPTPDVFAGYSLGELCSYATSETLSDAQVIQLAVKRAAIMDQATQNTHSGLIAVVGMNQSRLERLLEKNGGYLSLINTDDQFVVGANLDQLPAIEQAMSENGAQRVERLQVSFASHTPFLKDAMPLFKDVLEKQEFASPRNTLLSGVSASPVWNKTDMVQALSSQLCTTVNWRGCIESAWMRGCRVFLELGPGKGLSHMVQKLYPEADASSLEDFKDLSQAGNWVYSTLRRHQ